MINKQQILFQKNSKMHFFGSNKKAEISVEPKVIKFSPPFTANCVSMLKIKNTTSNQTIAYKIKAIQAQRYLVHPTSGILSPQQSCDVRIELRPFVDVTDLCRFIEGKRKFLIQSTIVPVTTPIGDVSEFMKQVPISQITENKVLTLFDVPDELERSYKSLRRNSPSISAFNCRSVILWLSILVAIIALVMYGILHRRNLFSSLCKLNLIRRIIDKFRNK